MTTNRIAIVSARDLEYELGIARDAEVLDVREKGQRFAKGIREAIDRDSYRVEKKAAMKIALADMDAEIEPVPTDARGHGPEPELDRLSNIFTVSA